MICVLFSSWCTVDKVVHREGVLMKSFALVTQHHRIVSSQLLPLVPFAELQVPGSVIFRGCRSGIDVPLYDVFSTSRTGIINRLGQRTLTLKNEYRVSVTLRINDDDLGGVPFQVEVWSIEVQRWVPFVLHEPIQMYLLRTPHSQLRIV